MTPFSSWHFAKEAQLCTSCSRECNTCQNLIAIFFYCLIYNWLPFVETNFELKASVRVTVINRLVWLVLILVLATLLVVKRPIRTNLRNEARYNGWGFYQYLQVKNRKKVLSPKAKLNRYFGRAYQRRLLTDRRNRSHKKREYYSQRKRMKTTTKWLMERESNQYRS